MLPALQSLIALQALDTATDAARRRLAELPAAEQEIQRTLAATSAAVEEVKTQQQENQHARRALEKDVAQVDTRLARFDDHKAAVKTNQEYTALLHEIATAKSEKDALEDRILVLMEDADRLGSELKAAQQTQATAKTDGDKARAALETERAQLERELTRLGHERIGEARGVEPPLMGKYDQLIKQRRGLAVAQMIGETCAACHVRLRPHVAQQIRRNDAIVQCDSCQRILYFQAPPA